jgi:ribonuclease G
VTDGPREIMTRKCPTCGGDGIVYSEASAAIDVERRIRALATGSKSQAFRIEVAAPIASALVGSGAGRLMELEALTKRRFFFEGKPNTHSDHFVVLGEGKLADLAPKAPFEEGAELTLELVEVDRHDAGAAVGKLDGFDICVGDAAELVGKKVKVRVERVLDGIAYATLVRQTKKAPEPLTAEAEAEKPTRKPPARKTAGAAGSETADDGEELDEAEEADDEPAVAEAPAARTSTPRTQTAKPAAARTTAADPATSETDTENDTADADGDEPAAATGAPAKKKTRRGSRGGRNRKKPAGAPTAASAAGEPADDAAEASTETDDAAAEETPLAVRTSTPRTPSSGTRSVTIHVPSDEFGRDADDDDEAEPATPAAEGAEASGNGVAPVKKKTRRGSRGGRNRKRPAGAGAAAAAAATNGAEPADEAELDDEPPAAAEPELAPEPVLELDDEPEPEPEVEADESDAADSNGDWGYVPMSEWGDDLKPTR